MYSDQPTIPSSVVTLRNELTRQPASQCRSSTLTIFIGVSSRPTGGEPLQFRDAGSRAIFVLLRGTAADAAGAFHDAVADDRHCPLTHDHVAARRGGNAARGRLVSPLAQLAAGTAEGSGGDGLALAAVCARPYGVVHALKRDQAAAAIANRGADLDVQLPSLRQGALDDAIGFVQCQSHRSLPRLKVERHASRNNPAINLYPGRPACPTIVSETAGQGLDLDIRGWPRE